MADPLVSVVIPFHSRVEELRRAVGSVALQDYRNIEIIIANDCSPDIDNEDLAILLEEMAPAKLLLVKTDRNLGAGGARALAISASEGDFVAFLDSDDTWLPNKLSRQVAYMEQNPEVFAVGGTVASASRLASGAESASVRFRKIEAHEWVRKNWLPTSTAVVRNLNLRFVADMRYAEDYATWLSDKRVIDGTAFSASPMAVSHKLPLVDEGLSSQLLKMEIGELNAIMRAQWGGKRGGAYKIVAMGISALKFAIRYLRSAPVKLVRRLR